MLKLPRKPPSKLCQAWTFIVERRASFSFTIGSIAYGLYHFFNRNILVNTDAYKVLDKLFGFIGGKYFGLVFIVLGFLKLYGIVSDKTIFKIPLYFALLFLWIILGVCFLIAYLEGYPNAAWIYTFIIAGLSTNILTTTSVIIKEGSDG